MDGPVIARGDRGFDDERRVWNAEIDRRPAVIARCASTADVVRAIGLARRLGLDIAVRGGAHNTAGTATCDGGLMIDLSLMSQVTVDPDARRARVGGGALLADVDAATLAQRAGRARRADQPHRGRGTDARRRHGLAEPQVSA